MVALQLNGNLRSARQCEGQNRRDRIPAQDCGIDRERRKGQRGIPSHPSREGLIINYPPSCCVYPPFFRAREKLKPLSFQNSVHGSHSIGLMPFHTPLALFACLQTQLAWYHPLRSDCFTIRRWRHRLRCSIFLPGWNRRTKFITRKIIRQQLVD